MQRSGVKKLTAPTEKAIKNYTATIGKLVEDAKARRIRSRR